MEAVKLTGKNALVLGAARGVGRDIALTLAGEGVNIIAPYYDWPHDCGELIRRLEVLDGHHLTMRADLRQEDEVRELAARIKSEYGCLDILINNIERGGMPIVHGPYTPEQWELEMATTLRAKWLVFQETLHLLKKSAQGAVVNISSIAGLIGRAGPAGLIFNDAYAAANRAVSSFTETWARQAAPAVRVNELMLGFIESRHAEGTRGWEMLSDEERRAITERSLLARTGCRAEVSRAVLFLIRDATFMTGAVVTMDGGFRLGHDAVPEMPPGTDNLGIQVT
ncbi:SDR family NAD(P)-dependent oxidoreductase [Desulfobacterota bacterium M19]